MAKVYDLAIIGGGPAGLAAAMYAGRLGMSTVLFGDTVGGAIVLTDSIENYPGFKKISGADLGDKLKEHAKDYKTEIFEDAVVKVEPYEDVYNVYTKENSFLSKTILFATGTKHRKLQVPGSEKFEKRGVYYCALCDGPLFRGKIVAVIGGSDSAVKEALFLSNYASKVYIIYRGEKIRSEPINAKKVKENTKIEIITNTNVAEMNGDGVLRGVLLDREYKGNKNLKLDAIFVAIGGIPQSDLARALGVETNNKGEIRIDRHSRTNVPGIFAAGDVTDTEFKQAITGVAEGVIAAYQAYHYINEKEFVCTCFDEEYSEK